MSATSTTLAGREAAAALMQDTCTITRGTPTSTFNAESGEYVTTNGTALYTGPCRVKPRDNTDRVVDGAGEPISLFPYIVSVPIDATAYLVDDLITVTAGALDPTLVGLVLRVKQPLMGSTLTARRLGCEVNAG